MQINWEPGFTIAVRAESGEVTIGANRAGLLSLAEICAALAQEAPGSHIHLDEWNALEDGSVELIVEKTP